MSGHWKAFHDPRNVIRPAVIRAGIERGRTMLQRNRRCPAPSIRAASASSFGIDRKNWRMRKIENALAMKGTICTWYVSNQPRQGRPAQATLLGLMSTYLGISVASPGIMSVARKIVKRTPLPRNLIRAKAYAARHAVTSSRIVTETDTKIVLTK